MAGKTPKEEWKGNVDIPGTQGRVFAKKKMQFPGTQVDPRFHPGSLTENLRPLTAATTNQGNH